MEVRKLGEAVNNLPVINTTMMMRGCINYIRDNFNLMGHLSVDSSELEYYCIDNILADLKQIGDAMVKYGEWMNDSIAHADDVNASDALKEVFDVFNAQSVQNYRKNHGEIDIFSILNLKKLTDAVNKLLDLKLIIESQFISPTGLTMLSLLVDCVEKRLWTIFNSVAEATFEHSTYRARGLPQRSSVIISDVPLFCKWNDDVVSLSEEEKEIAAQKEAERKRAEEARILAEKKAAELDARRTEVASHAKLIMDAYDQHNKMGNIPNVKFKDSVEKSLRELNTEDDCQLAEKIYRFLYSMADSVRYMPGEKGDPFDRIMGSFMELNNDIASYHATFTVYTDPTGMLRVNDIATACESFEFKEGRMQAQFVDNKKYITADTIECSSSKMIHLIWCD